MLILVDLDYLQAFNEGWAVIVAAPIQFFAFILLLIPSVWILVHRSFKHALAMETSLKESYKEQVGIIQKNTTILNEELARVRASGQAKTQDIATLQERITWFTDQASITRNLLSAKSEEADLASSTAKRLQAELQTLQFSSESTIRGLESDKRELRQELQRIQNLKGIDELFWLPVDRKSVTFSSPPVIIRYYEVVDHPIADKISNAFKDGYGGLAWRTSIQKDGASVPPKRQGQTRIFISSRDTHLASKVGEIFNESVLLPEDIGLNVDEPLTAEILITIYPRI